MQRTCLGVLLLLILAFASPAFSQSGNGAPNGAHYNLNIRFLAVSYTKCPQI